MPTTLDLTTISEAVPDLAAASASDSAPDTAPIKTTFSVEEIHEMLPHRFPFALVDRIIDFVPGKLAVGLKNVTMNEPQFQGHFPGRPIMPGVLIVEAMAQVGGVVLRQMADIPDGLFMFAGIDNVRFRRPVVPGDQLIMTVELISLRGRRFGKMKGRAEVEGKLACEGDLMFALVE